MSLHDLFNAVSALQSSAHALNMRIAVKDGVRARVEAALIPLDETVKAATADTQTLKTVLSVFDEMAKHVQGQVSTVETLCTGAIQSVLTNPDISFCVRTEVKRGVVETSFVINDALVGELDIMRSEAGGLKNVIAACLRLIFAELCSPRVDGPIILDEVGYNIGEENQENFGRFLAQFSKSTKRQIILVSHQRPVITEAGSVITLQRVGKVSCLKEA